MEKENSNYNTYIKGFILGCIRYNLTDKVKALYNAYLKDNPDVSKSKIFHRSCIVVYEDYCNDEIHKDITKFYYNKFKDK